MPPGMFEWGVQKSWGGRGLGVFLQEKKKFKILVLKWPILTEMTVKYGIYFYFFLPTIPPPVVLSGGGGGPDPPCGNPALFKKIDIIYRYI